MSFAVTNQNTGNFITALSGIYGIATQFSGGNGLLYYSIDYGSGFSTWTLSTTGSVPNVTFSSISLSGQNGVAAGIDNSSSLPSPVCRVYFTGDGGSSWTPSTGLPSLFSTSSVLVSIVGSNALLGINRLMAAQAHIYYSNNGGSTWISGPSLATNTYVDAVAVSSSSMITIIRDSAYTYINNSTDNGSTFNFAFSVIGLANPSLSSLGANSVLCGQIGGNGYIVYSNNNGDIGSWANPILIPPLTLTNNITKVVSIGGSVALIGGINGTTAFIWYSTDGGANWTASNFVLANASSFTGISVSGNNGLASINDSAGIIFDSSDQGQNWINIASFFSNTVNDVSLSGNEGVAGTSNGIYYTISPLCYEANTLILILENEEEVYKKVSELKVGDLVKTYKQGYKKIKLFRSFKYKPLNRNNDLNLLYKHKENGVVVTGGHSILVDELTEQEKVNNLKHYGFNQTIEDKKLLLACSSDKFEKIDDYREEYNLCHFSLESDNPKEHFGVYITDGILSESCPEETLLKML